MPLCAACSHNHSAMYLPTPSTLPRPPAPYSPGRRGESVPTGPSATRPLRRGAAWRGPPSEVRRTGYRCGVRAPACGPPPEGARSGGFARCPQWPVAQALGRGRCGPVRAGKTPGERPRQGVSPGGRQCCARGRMARLGDLQGRVPNGPRPFVPRSPLRWLGPVANASVVGKGMPPPYAATSR